MMRWQHEQIYEDDPEAEPRDANARIVLKLQAFRHGKTNCMHGLPHRDGTDTRRCTEHLLEVSSLRVWSSSTASHLESPGQKPAVQLPVSECECDLTPQLRKIPGMDPGHRLTLETGYEAMKPRVSCSHFASWRCQALVRDGFKGNTLMNSRGGVCAKPNGFLACECEVQFALELRRVSREGLSGTSRILHHLSGALHPKTLSGVACVVCPSDCGLRSGVCCAQVQAAEAALPVADFPSCTA